MVDEGHFYKRIPIAKATIIYEFFKIAHVIRNLVMALRWCINRFSGLLIFQCGAGQFSKAGFTLFQRGLYFNNLITSKQAFFLNGFKTFFKSCCVIVHFFSCRTGKSLRYTIAGI